MKEMLKINRRASAPPSKFPLETAKLCFLSGREFRPASSFFCTQMRATRPRHFPFPKRSSSLDGVRFPPHTQHEQRHIAKNMEKTSKRPAAAPPRPNEQGTAGAATTSSAPAFFLLLLKLMMLTGVLDPYDWTVIARCSLEARDAVASFWGGFCVKNPATRLRSVERLVEDRALNMTGFQEYVPVSQAANCVICATRTRCRHPVDGSMLCTPCGIEKVDPGSGTGRNGRGGQGPLLGDSPFFHFCMIDESQARQHLGISPEADLGKHLRFAERRGWLDSQQGIYSNTKYAPEFAAAAKIGLNVSARRAALTRFNSDVSLERVFLTRDIVCLLLEKYGGPRQLNERIRNLALPALDPAKPDE